MRISKVKKFLKDSILDYYNFFGNFDLLTRCFYKEILLPGLVFRFVYKKYVERLMVFRFGCLFFKCGIEMKMRDRFFDFMNVDKDYFFNLFLIGFSLAGSRKNGLIWNFFFSNAIKAWLKFRIILDNNLVKTIESKSDQTKIFLVVNERILFYNFRFFSRRFSIDMFKTVCFELRKLYIFNFLFILGSIFYFIVFFFFFFFWCFLCPLLGILKLQCFLTVAK